MRSVILKSLDYYEGDRLYLQPDDGYRSVWDSIEAVFLFSRRSYLFTILCQLVLNALK